MDDHDEYEIFLENWEPSGLLRHATRPQNLSDPLIRKRLADDSSGQAGVERTLRARGYKAMTREEIAVRAYDFFQSRQNEWAAHFKDHVLNAGVAEKKFDVFTTCFAQFWTDGKKKRQDSTEIQSIKASIRNFDLIHHAKDVDRFVVNSVDISVSSLLSAEEMRAIFDANYGLIDAFMPEYIDAMGHDGPGSLDNLYVRRGVYRDLPGKILKELNYLSSYSLALSLVEQFAQPLKKNSLKHEIPCIFSAPISAVQKRIVAFAPFIEGMDLSQMELVTAPPVEEIVLRDDGEHGGIHEFSFY